MSRLAAAHDYRNTAGNLDTTPPSVPGTVTATNVGATTAIISWGAATDNVAVTGYNIYQVPAGSGGGPFTPVLIDTVTGSGGSLAYRAGATGNNGQTGIGVTTCAIAVPGSAAAGDTAFVTLASNSGSNTISVAPAGWNLGSGPDHASVNNISSWVYVKKLAAADLGTSPTWTLSGGARFIGVMDVFSGANAPGAVTFRNQTGANTALTDATVTTLSASSLVYAVWIARSATGTPCALTLPSSPAYTADQTCASNNGTTNHTIKTGHFTTTTAGAYGGNTGASAPAATPADYYAIEIAGVGGLSDALSGLDPGADNTIQVRAFDARGNEGPAATVVITTSGVTDITPPTIPSGLTARASTTTTNTFTWAASSDDQSGVDHYIALRGGVDEGHPTALTFTDTGLTASTAYTYTLQAVDVAGNISDPSTALIMTTAASVDTTNPSAVTGLTAANVLTTQTGLAWDEATDNSGSIDHYLVYWDAGSGGAATTLKKTTTGDVLTTSITGLAAASSYRFAVSAVDPSGNEGAKSGTITVTTAGAGGSGGIFYGLNARADVADKLRLSDRNAANGWVTAGGQAMVDGNGNATGLGLTRCYNPGGLPNAFDAANTTGGSGVNVNKRANVTFKLSVDWPTAVGGGYDLPFCRWANSIPSGWDIWYTPHHEPNGDFTSTNTPAAYLAMMRRFACLAMGVNPSTIGQAGKNGAAPALSLNSGVTLHLAICFTIPHGAGSNHWDQMQNALPKASQLADPTAITLLDAYQNAPPAINAPLPGGGVDDLYPTPGSIWNFYFNNVHSQYGYDVGQHGYGIGEWMAPPRDNDNATFTGQADALTSYFNFLEGQAAPPNGPGQPKILCMWENPASQGNAGASFTQLAHNKARAVFASHALGTFAAT